MKFNSLIILISSLFLSCNSNEPSIIINKSGNTIRERISTPPNYQWINEASNSFGEFLQNVLVKPDGSKILDYTGNPISNQSEHVAILGYDVGSRDLQQCADAIIRLRAEYLYSLKRFNEIEFHFTSGDLFKWNDYKNGVRPVISNNKVRFEITANEDDSYANFKKYLNVIYAYAGTISLNKETRKVLNDEEIKPGDVLINPGSPGHAVLIVGRANGINGKIIYLLAEGYTPAQSIHIITNPFNDEINPWYTLSIFEPSTRTARYTFSKTNIRTF